MALENNRLNFPKMVDRHIKVSIQKPMGDTQDNLAFFDPLIMSGRELDVMKNEPYVPPMPTNVETSINSIVATVHRNLQKEKRRPITSPARKEKPEEKATPEQEFKPMNIIDDSGNNNNNKNDNNANNNSKANNNSNANKNTRNNIINGNTKKNKANKKISFQAKSPQKPNDTNVSKNKISVNLQKIYQQPGRNKSIPQIKAHTARKIQQRQHNVPDNPNTYETQKRLRSVLHQKRVLEEILEEHEKIQRDRRNISMEIQVMKQYLADIRYKLDSSLKKLGVKQLIIEKNPRLIKRMIPVISSTTSTNAKNNNKGISINTNTVCKGSTTENKGAPQK